MESEVPNLFIMFSKQIVNQPEHFLGSGVEVTINDPGDRAPDDLSDDRKRVLSEITGRMVEYSQLLDYTKGVLKHTEFKPEIDTWTSENVTCTILRRVMSLAYKAVNPTETLIVLDRPLQPDDALALAINLRGVATKINALNCNVKVRFGLLGTGVIHIV